MVLESTGTTDVFRFLYAPGLSATPMYPGNSFLRLPMHELPKA